jgi:hypothetical protein
MNDDEYFDNWIDNVVSSSNLIADPDALRKVWIDHATGITSVYDPDELLEQLLSDLRVHERVHLFEERLRRAGSFEAFAALAQALVELEKAIADDPRLERPESLLGSQSWRNVQAAAIEIGRSPLAKNLKP